MRSFQIIVLVTILHLVVGQAALAIHEGNSASGNTEDFFHSALELIIQVLYFPAGPLVSMMPDDIMRSGLAYVLLVLFNAILWGLVINLLTKPFRRNTKWTNTL